MLLVELMQPLLNPFQLRLQTTNLFLCIGVSIIVEVINSKECMVCVSILNDKSSCSWVQDLVT